jgi:SAM-dependent methyltransferase
MTNEASKFVGLIPRNYDQFLGPRIFHQFADDLVGRVGELAPRSVLELAAGTGIVTRRLRDALPDGCAILATDLNSPMLKVAKSKFRADESIDFEPADATNLSFDDASYDVCVCQFGVMFFPDKQRSYQEVLRVLKPKGRYIFNVWGSWEKNPFAQIAHEAVATFFPDDPPGFYKVPFSYHEVDKIEDALRRAGFSRVSAERVRIISTIPSAGDFATGLVFGNPLFQEIKARGGDPDRVCAAVAAAIEQHLGESLSLEAHVVSAAKD